MALSQDLDLLFQQYIPVELTNTIKYLDATALKQSDF